jgi:hypothetical protein
MKSAYEPPERIFCHILDLSLQILKRECKKYIELPINQGAHPTANSIFWNDLNSHVMDLSHMTKL